MPTEAQIRAAIKTKMFTVAKIGAVHDYERYTDKMSDFRAFYQATIDGVPQVRGWYIRMLVMREASDYNDRREITYSWRLQGYMSLDDEAASEKVFAAVIENLATAFRNDETLGGVVDTNIVGDEAGLQVEDAGPVMFGGVLCHAARCRLMTRHYI